jgi:ankyrin repeat protein
VDDPALTRLLLERGADPNVRSADGRTPLFLAANRHGSVEIVRQLLAHDARVDGQPVLTRAAAAGDAQTMRLLIERGVEPDVRTIEQALESRCAECLELALGSATVPQLNRGLAWAASFGDSSHIRSLLDRGAVASGAALKSAAASEKIPVDGVTALLDRGARDEGALAQAIRHGNTGVVAALMRAGATAIAIPPDPELKRPSVPRTARAAVEKSLPLLQRVDERFLKTSGCVSCHNNSVFRMTVAAVRKNGCVVGDAAASTVSITGAYIEGFRERALQDIPIPGGVDTMSYILDGLAAAQYPPDPATDALARYLKRRQAADGRWAVTTQRPPIESSDAAITALTARALQAYAPAPQRTEYLEAVQRAAGWLQQAEARTMEDHAFRLLGLVWTHQSKTSIGRAVQTLKSLQRADGGWSQLPTLGSDSYATGQALVALHEAGVSVNDAGYRRGVQFLLATQLEDGSWYVRSRAIAVQPHFDSGFPHGADQFISAAATNWATMALAPAR